MAEDLFDGFFFTNPTDHDHESTSTSPLIGFSDSAYSPLVQISGEANQFVIASAREPPTSSDQGCSAYLCLLCDYYCEDATEIIEHLDIEHLISYSCTKPSCGQTLSSVQSYIQHAQDSHDVSISNPVTLEILKSIDVVAETPSQKCRCLICFINFDKLSDLQNHVKTSHKHFCRRCGILFCNKEEFFKHEVHHVKGKILTYTCSLCSKYFISREMFRNHALSHKEKVKCKVGVQMALEPAWLPSDCPYCVESCEDNLMEHFKSHTMNRCSECDVGVLDSEMCGPCTDLEKQQQQPNRAAQTCKPTETVLRKEQDPPKSSTDATSEINVPVTKRTSLKTQIGPNLMYEEVWDLLTPKVSTSNSELNKKTPNILKRGSSKRKSLVCEQLICDQNLYNPPTKIFTEKIPPPTRREVPKRKKGICKNCHSSNQDLNDEKICITCEMEIIIYGPTPPKVPPEIPEIILEDDPTPEVNPEIPPEISQPPVEPKKRKPSVYVDPSSRYLDPNGRFACDYCDLRFSSGYGRNTHMKLNHDAFNKNMCPYCDKIVTDTSFAYHLTRHRMREGYMCETCGTLFCRQVNLDIHKVNHLPVEEQRKFDCQKCGRRYKSDQHLRKHDAVAHRVKNLSCEHCTKTFNNLRSMADHMQLHIGILHFKCKICKARFTRKDNMTTHMRNNHRMLCPICNLIFQTADQVKKHRIVDHTEEENKKFDLNEVFKITRFQCEICSKFLASRQSLDFHRATHTGTGPKRPRSKSYVRKINRKRKSNKKSSESDTEESGGSENGDEVYVPIQQFSKSNSRDRNGKRTSVAPNRFSL